VAVARLGAPNLLRYFCPEPLGRPEATPTDRTQRAAEFRWSVRLGTTPMSDTAAFLRVLAAMRRIVLARRTPTDAAGRLERRKLLLHLRFLIHVPVLNV